MKYKKRQLEENISEIFKVLPNNCNSWDQTSSENKMITLSLLKHVLKGYFLKVRTILSESP